MKNSKMTIKFRFFVFIAIITLNSYAQNNNSGQVDAKSTPDFWKHVQFGGGIGFSSGNGYTNFAISPSAIYNFNEKISTGFGLQYNYLKSSSSFSSHMYGANALVLVNPIKEIQLSAEVEQLRVNIDGANSNSKDFWNTGLFLGAGYRMDSVTIGARYNLLYKTDNGVYADAFMPFVRVYF
ncbi:hypothetical protein [Flavobacterium croceum]|nr:hypothetical protein [Flavobacterium croceum]